MPEKRKATKKRKMEIITPKKEIMEAVKCGTTEQAYTIFKDLLDYEEYELKSQEHFWVMGIDGAGYVTCVYIAAIGADNREIIDPLDVFSMAIAQKSRTVVLAHNHPAGLLPIPSEADIDLTNRLYHACLQFGLTILDHIILIDDGFTSLLKNGDMDNIFVSRKYKSYYKVKPQLDKEKEEEKATSKQEGIIEGLDNGIKIGTKRGEKVGLKKGEHDKAVEIAKKMLLKNKPLKEIIEFTGLSKKEINKLSNG